MVQYWWDTDRQTDRPRQQYTELWKLWTRSTEGEFTHKLLVGRQTLLQIFSCKIHSIFTDLSIDRNRRKRLASCFRIISLRIGPANDDVFFKLMPLNLSRQSLEKGITWRDDREWLNGVLRDGEKNDDDHYMLMHGRTPYDDYAAFQRASRECVCEKKKREKRKISRYRCNLRLFDGRNALSSVLLVKIISLFGRRFVIGNRFGDFARSRNAIRTWALTKTNIPIVGARSSIVCSQILKQS